MHRLRTCAARLRPLTASQAAQTVSQQRPITVTSTGGTRTFQPIRCYTAPVASEPFLNGTSSNYVEEMYYAWLEDPKSVHKVRSAAAPCWSGGHTQGGGLVVTGPLRYKDGLNVHVIYYTQEQMFISSAYRKGNVWTYLVPNHWMM